jgi:hypothetical protein
MRGSYAADVATTTRVPVLSFREILRTNTYVASHKLTGSEQRLALTMIVAGPAGGITLVREERLRPFARD